MEKILEIEPFVVTGHYVHTEDASYIRYAPDHWEWMIGECTETVFTRVEKLESAFQEYMRNDQAGIDPYRGS